MKPKKIVFATFGTMGDVRPYLAVAAELQKRGHETILGGMAPHREMIESAGVSYRLIPPDLEHVKDDPEAVRSLMNPRTGSFVLMRKYVIPATREAYASLSEFASDADLIVAHPISFAAAMFAEKHSIPWVSTSLAPLSFFSVYDPPVIPTAPELARLRSLGPGFNALLARFMRLFTRSWSAELRRIRREFDLPDKRGDLFFNGRYSPLMTLAMFSPLLGKPQPDWPPNTVITGLPMVDLEKEPPMEPRVQAFMEEGEPPILFTLGSAASQGAGDYYQVSAEAAHRVGRRALLAGTAGEGPYPGEVCLAGYIPYAEAFEKAAAVVHHGGVGTTQLGLRSGKPTLIVPFSHDQPDNAARAKRLGVSLTLPRKRYKAGSVAKALSRLLTEPSFAQRAAEAGEQIRQENGAATAADALETLLTEKRP